jgi:glutathionyl-hydroquinone reductase
MNYPDFKKFSLYDESIVTIVTNTSSPIVETFNTNEK